MIKYEVSVSEILERIIEIEAESEDEAYDIVSQMYDAEEIVLDGGDFQGREIEVLGEVDEDDE